MDANIAVNNFNNNSILILNGHGNGTFVSGETYSTGNQSTPQYQCCADLNNDNRMDIIIANLGSNCVGILLEQDNGTFANVTSYSILVMVPLCGSSLLVILIMTIKVFFSEMALDQPSEC